jgi:hypothetical protein
MNYECSECGQVKNENDIIMCLNSHGIGNNQVQFFLAPVCSECHSKEKLQDG